MPRELTTTVDLRAGPTYRHLVEENRQQAIEQQATGNKQ
jgi:hypothetical protein